MGGGSWDSRLFDTASKARATAGVDDFAYSRAAIRSGSYKIHPVLDPTTKQIRESRDSADHPASFPIAVFFDVTGSMGVIPEVFQKQLGSVLMTLLVEQYGIADAQVLVGAVGDGKSDRVPFQIAEFESDNRIDEHLRNVILEGNGGGQHFESYGFGYYAGARMLRHDHFDKRGGKGILFTMGDEACWPEITRQECKRWLGIDAESDLSVRQLIEEGAAKWHFVHIVNADGSYGTQWARDWQDLLGEYGKVVVLQDHRDVAAMVAAHAAQAHGLESDSILTGLRAAGIDSRAIDSVSRSLVVRTGTVAGRGTVQGSLPARKGAGGGAARI